MKSIVLWLAAALCCGVAQAQVPHQINYQGYLKNPGGTPVNSAGLQMVLSLYDVSTAGGALHSETQTVPVANGVFNVLIGAQAGTPLVLPFDKPYWLGVTVTVAGDAEMAPRQAVLSSPYALNAASAEGLAAVDAVTVFSGGKRILQLQSVTDGSFSNTVNVLGGSQFNTIGAGIVGATVAGGGTKYVGADWRNQVQGNFGTVGGGYANTAGAYGSIGGGTGNSASASGTVGGGSGNAATGSFSTVGGGEDNTASGDHSWAGGRHARTEAGIVKHNGAFVWADSNDGVFQSSVPNEFAVRATGGFRLVTAVDGSFNPARTFSINGNGAVTIPVLGIGPNVNLVQDAADGDARVRFSRKTDSGNFWEIAAGSSANALYVNRQGYGSAMSLTPDGSNLLTMGNGARLTAGGAWTNASDRNAKENFSAVDAREVLAHVVSLPVTAWNYRSEPGVKRIGPMAQDFYAAFGLGHDDTGISTVDESGVALAAIQGLNARIEEMSATLRAELQERDVKGKAQAAQLAELQAARDADRREIAELRQVLGALLARAALDSRLAQAH